MNKFWDGNVPRYTGPFRRGGWADGYRAAMNSPEVRALYVAAKHLSLESGSSLVTTDWAKKQVTGYEAGVKESSYPLPSPS